MEILKQPNNNPKIIEVQIFLVALGNLGFLDSFDLKYVKQLISYSNGIINGLFGSEKLSFIVTFFRYLNAKQVANVVGNLLKYSFTKSTKLNLTK